MRLVFAGTPDVAVPTLRALLDAPRHEVVAVVTRPDRPAGRGRHVADSPVKATALAAGVEVLQPERARDPGFLDRLRTLAPDCCPVVAYGGLLPPAALEIPAHGWVNLHFSLLPHWRGAAPVQHAILAGDDVTGASTFQIEEGLDTGPVYGVVTTEIDPQETAGELLSRLAETGAGLMLATIDGIADGSLVPRPQPDDGASYAGKIEVDDARIDWSAPALRIDRLVRACTPAPGAWTTFRDRRVKLGPVRHRSEASLAPGEIRAGRHDVVVGCGSNDVELTEVRPEGRGAMTAAEWARGVRLQPGERFS
ncbi:MAG TPA: methionyl-tRNA formyltransferase [Mycobacteriales bacterium]|nr:methionyl-tRNA formyltransferase [Mycobacteriales bacterium]